MGKATTEPLWVSDVECTRPILRPNGEERVAVKAVKTVKAKSDQDDLGLHVTDVDRNR